jgi:hypothetical protein
VLKHHVGAVDNRGQRRLLRPPRHLGAGRAPVPQAALHHQGRHHLAGLRAADAACWAGSSKGQAESACRRARTPRASTSRWRTACWWAHAQEAAGKLTASRPSSRRGSIVGQLRYDGGEYFWINDMQPRMVMHPIKPDLDGQDLAAMKDPNGFALFNAFVDTVRKDGKGFVAYQWPKPGSSKPVDKVSYVQGFEPWGWVVGSGIYVDDLRAAAEPDAWSTAASCWRRWLWRGTCS